jgi:oxaloacetate decarboxylase alpha subunit
MRRVFIANRGEIAVRVVRACRELGLECVVGCSQPDRDAMAARLADRAVVIGPGPATASYLRHETVVQAALGTGCDAIHPGYGFLAESPRLAGLARDNGLVFVGPPPQAMEVAGDKLRAREQAARAGVPVLGGHEIESVEQAHDVGYPLLVKAAGGGGGRGIKLARHEHELERLLGLARSEAGAAFGDDRVYVERFVEAARHVEVQVVGDAAGNVVHLGERDCSVQRRYQKVIEEAPAPSLAHDTRAALHDAAVRFARAIGYRNAGTVEFIVDAESEQFFFLEMNCRIQVEHPVTEAITGRDLVVLARDAVAVLDPGPAAPAGRHSLPARCRRAAVLRLAAGQARSPRVRPRQRDPGAPRRARGRRRRRGRDESRAARRRARPSRLPQRHHYHRLAGERAGMSRTIEIVDTTTRDGNQSLWSATGLTTPDVLAIAPTMDRVGYHALDFTSSTHMAVSVRFHREDPWERIRLVSEAMPNTPLSMITTGMRFISWVPANEDVIALSLMLVARNGIRRLQIADPSNDPDRLKRIASLARREGIEEVVIGLTYSISAVHTHSYYAERAAALTGYPEMDRLYLKDPGGLLTPDAVRELAPHFLAAAGERMVELHSHCTIGLAPLVYMEGVKAGFAVVHTACGPLSRGTSQPEVVNTVANLEANGYAHGLDLDAQATVAEHFHELARAKGLPAGAPREFDAAYYRHQLPGGMVTTTRRMLEELRRPELFDAVLEEVTRVRAEMGYPILVTPVSQFVASQAARNVIDGERWANVSDETVRYFLGHYGDPAAPVDPAIADRVLARPQATKLRDLEPITLEGARERFGRRISEEELLLRLTMPEAQVDAMVAARDGGGGAPLPAARPGRSPLVTLLKELQNRRSISELTLTKDGETVVWRRA